MQKSSRFFLESFLPLECLPRKGKSFRENFAFFGKFFFRDHFASFSHFVRSRLNFENTRLIFIYPRTQFHNFFWAINFNFAAIKLMVFKNFMQFRENIFAFRKKIILLNLFSRKNGKFRNKVCETFRLLETVVSNQSYNDTAGSVQLRYRVSHETWQ